MSKRTSISWFIIALLYLAAIQIMILTFQMIIGYGYLGWSDYVLEDRTPCYANSTLGHPYFYRDLPSPEEIQQSNMVNVSAQFKFLFRSGTIVLSCLVALAILNQIQLINKNKYIRITFRILLGIAVIAYFAHFITSNIFRFSKEGKVCSGDFCDFYEEEQYLFNVTRQCHGLEQPREKGPIFYDTLQGKFLLTIIMSQWAWYFLLAFIAIVYFVRSKITQSRKNQ